MTPVSAAAIYTRISNDDQGKALGVERQEEACRRLAETKGWPVVRVYCDNDFSASRYSKRARVAYVQMLDDIRAGMIDAVLVLDQDRLVRQARELEDFIDLANAHGIALANASGDLDLSTSDGRLTARIRGTVAAHESEKKSERLRRQGEQAAAKGLPAQRPRTFGYELGSMSLRQPEADALREAAAQLLADPPATMRSICDRWNAAGLFTAAGNRWDSTMLRSTLTAPKVAGLRVHRGEIVGEGVWPPILDRETFERLCARLEARRRPAGRPHRSLLSGIAVCGRCGHDLIRGSSGKESAYLCSRQRREGACGSLAVRAASVEAYVEAQVLAVLPRRASGTSRPVSPAGLGGDLQRAEEALRQLSQDHYVDSRITRAEFFAAREPLERRIGQLRAQEKRAARRSALAAAPAGAVAVRQWYADQSTVVRREIIGAIVDKVVVAPLPRSAPRRFDPDRVDIRWRE